MLSGGQSPLEVSLNVWDKQLYCLQASQHKSWGDQGAYEYEREGVSHGNPSLNPSPAHSQVHFLPSQTMVHMNVHEERLGNIFREP